MDGIAGVEARIQEITSRFGLRAAGGPLGANSPAALGDVPDPNAGTFADALSQAEGTTNGAPATGAGAPASSGTPNLAGVDPVKWARDFLAELGMPATSENVRAITAWEQAEGTKAKFNPLATTQAGFAGETRFNSVGVKNYVSYRDGIDANVRAITNGRYANILDALRAGNSAIAVGQAIADSPWGTHGGVLRVLRSQSR